jgi:hypothetical protein
MDHGQCLFLRWKFAKIWAEKYGFDLNKGFVMEKMTQTLPDLENKISKLPEFYDKF